MKLVFTFLLFFLFSIVTYAQESVVEVVEINFIGLNKTNEKVILNELTFKTKDLIDLKLVDSLLNYNSNQLYNLQLFHWIKYNYKISEEKISIEFQFQERWYFWPIPIFSQADRNISSWIKNWDYNLLDYGLHFEHKNFRGKNEKLKSNIQLGYNQKYELFYTKPYIDTKQKYGLNFGISHYRSHYSFLEIESAKPIRKQLSTEYAVQNSYLKAGVFRRQNVSNILNLSAEFHNLILNDSLFYLNSTLFENRKYSNFINLEISHIINKRTTFSYPKKGYYLDYKFNQRIGLSTNNLSLTTIQINASIYQPLNKKIFFTSGISSTINISKHNYFLDHQILGYKKYVRGYEYYVTHGNSMFLHKNGLNYSLFENKIVKFKMLKSEKFNTIPVSLYLSLFGDWAYVNSRFKDTNNYLANNVQYGTGIGLHLVTYYDRVLVLEYSFNKMGGNGIFISNTFPF